MKDDIRRAFDGMAEEPHPALRAAVRARLAGGPLRTQSAAWRLAAAVAVVAIVALAAYSGFHAIRPGGLGSGPVATGSNPTPAASPSVSASPSDVPIFTQIPGPPFTCGDLSGGSSVSTVEVTDVRVGTAAGYDRFVIEFSGPVPSFTVTRQNDPTFTGDASGQPFNLQGNGGVRVVVHGASTMGQTWAADDKPGYPELKEAQQTGSFEAVFSWGLGVAANDGGCLRTMILTGPDRLVIDLQQP